MNAPVFKYEKLALQAGLILVGVLCLTGETYGLSGKGRVYRSEEPGYFAMLFFARLMIGGICLTAGLAIRA